MIAPHMAGLALLIPIVLGLYMLRNHGDHLADRAVDAAVYLPAFLIAFGIGGFIVLGWAVLR